MSASAHREEAADYKQSAARQQAQYDPDAEVRQGGSRASRATEYDIKTYNPTAGHLQKAIDDREIAREHEAAAVALESFTDAECAEFPSATRKVCPLLTVVVQEQDIAGGVRLFLADGTLPSAVLDHMRCHHAFAREKGYSGMPECPLYLKDVDMSLDPDGKTVLITSRDAATAVEIRQRARAHLAQ
jgi:hypothetical protein